MFDTIFSAASNTTTTSTTIPLMDSVFTIIVAFILGGIISLTYMKTSSKRGHSQNFSVTLVILPVVISIIVLLLQEHSA